MKVRDFMKTDLPYVGLEDNLTQVMEEMRMKGSDAILVKEGDDIFGIITDTDIVANMAVGKDPERVLAKEFMTACEMQGTNPCLQIFEDDPIEDAMKVMGASGVRHLLVWGEGNRPVGVLCSHVLFERSEVLQH